MLRGHEGTAKIVIPDQKDILFLLNGQSGIYV